LKLQEQNMPPYSGSYHNYQNGTVSNQLTDIGSR
jgi:hypothetical protein